MSKLFIVLFFTSITWFNLARWVPGILTNPFIILPLLIGTLMIIWGVISSLGK